MKHIHPPINTHLHFCGQLPGAPKQFPVRYYLLQKYKFGPDSVKNLLGVESASHPEGTASNPNEIKRKTADGRIAIYDQNKKFLRYQDQAPQQEMQQQ